MIRNGGISDHGLTRRERYFGSRFRVMFRVTPQMTRNTPENHAQATSIDSPDMSGSGAAR
jgi:hypothetical protein